MLAVESVVQETGESLDTSESAVSVEPEVSAPRGSTQISHAQLMSLKIPRDVFDGEFMNGMCVVRYERKTPDALSSKEHSC